MTDRELKERFQGLWIELAHAIEEEDKDSCDKFLRSQHEFAAAYKEPLKISEETKDQMDYVEKYAKMSYLLGYNAALLTIKQTMRKLKERGE